MYVQKEIKKGQITNCRAKAAIAISERQERKSIGWWEIIQRYSRYFTRLLNRSEEEERINK